MRVSECILDVMINNLRSSECPKVKQREKKKLPIFGPFAPQHTHTKCVNVKIKKKNLNEDYSIEVDLLTCGIECAMANEINIQHLNVIRARLDDWTIRRICFLISHLRMSIK